MVCLLLSSCDLLVGYSLVVVVSFLVMVRGSLDAISVRSSLSLQRAGVSFLVVVGLIFICHRVTSLYVSHLGASSCIVAGGFSREVTVSSS